MTHRAQSDGTALANTHATGMGTPRPIGGGCSSYALRSGTHQPTGTVGMKFERMRDETLKRLKEKKAHAGKLAAARTVLMVPMPKTSEWGGLAERGLSFSLCGVPNG